MPPSAVNPGPSAAALVAAIRGPAAQLADDEAFRGLLHAAGVTRSSTNELELVQQRSRFGLYRELVHARFLGALEVSIPHTLGRLRTERVGEMLDAFIEERASRSPYLRDVAREFVEWAAPLWRTRNDLPAYLSDLARYELLSFEVGAGPDDLAGAHAAVSADAAITVQATARLEHFEYAVHLIASEEQVNSSEHAERRSCWLLAYRDASQRTRYLELTEFGATLLAGLMHGATLRRAIAQACADTNKLQDDDLLADVAMLLNELDRRGAILS